MPKNDLGHAQGDTPEDETVAESARYPPNRDPIEYACVYCGSSARRDLLRRSIKGFFDADLRGGYGVRRPLFAPFG
jgi:hypothetical protein